MTATVKCPPGFVGRPTAPCDTYVRLVGFVGLPAAAAALPVTVKVDVLIVPFWRPTTATRRSPHEPRRPPAC